MTDETDNHMNKKERWFQVGAQACRRMDKEGVEQVYRLLKRIIDGLKPERIFLFGSHANGNDTTDSDIDILIIKESDERSVVRRGKVLQLIKGSGIPKDIFVLTPKEFEETKDQVGSIAYEASHYGKVVYG